MKMRRTAPILQVNKAELEFYRRRLPNLWIEQKMPWGKRLMSNKRETFSHYVIRFCIWLKLTTSTMERSVGAVENFLNRFNYLLYQI